MAWPQYLIEIDFLNNPLQSVATNTWTDVSAYVHSFTITRGRSSELARIEAGTAQVTFDNSDRRFDPTYSGGPYYPNVVPMKKIRISATYAATTYRLFVGFIEEWPPDWPGGLDATTTIRAVDAFKYFALIKFASIYSYSNEYTNWSIDTWLTAINWPLSDRALSSGQSQIQAGTFSNTPALAHFQNVADVESGQFFMAGDGKATFHDRHYRLRNSVTSVATYGDAAGEIPWLYLASSYDDQNIWNEARITRDGGTEQVANDTTSQSRYFKRTYTKTLPIYSDGEALSLAQWTVALYKDPVFRFTSVTLDGRMDDAIWPEMFGRTLGQRVTIRQRPPPITTAIEQDCYIEGVAYSVNAQSGDMRAVFQLSPAPTGAAGAWWILQDATFGVLNSTTRLAY